MIEKGLDRRNDEIKKRYLLGIITIIMCIIIGITGKTYNDRKVSARNKKYEISLVEALKNSYKNIIAINLDNPKYNETPSDWSVNVELIFKDKKHIYYRVGHSLKQKQNYDGWIEKDYKNNWKYLEEHKGKTMNTIKVKYSDQTNGKQ